MKFAERLFVLFTLVIVYAHEASANLGQDPKQVQNHYGAGKSILAEAPAEDAQVYSSHGMQILVEYWKGVSCSEQFQKKDGSIISQAETAAILAVNAGAASWQQTPSDTWIRADKAAIAYLSEHGKVLVIQRYDFYNEAKKVQEKPNTQ